MRFADRDEAGLRLAERLAGLASVEPIVIGLARGGVPIARAVSRRLAAPLDVMLVRRLRARGRPDVEVGMISASVLELDDHVLDTLDLPESWVRSAVVEEMAELRRREGIYRHGRARTDLGGRVALLVDDLVLDSGLMEVAIRSVRKRLPSRVIVAAPVVGPAVRQILLPWTDGVVSLTDLGGSADEGYDRRDPLTDAEVIAILR